MSDIPLVMHKFEDVVPAGPTLDEFYRVVDATNDAIDTIIHAAPDSHVVIGVYMDGHGHDYEVNLDIGPDGSVSKHPVILKDVTSLDESVIYMVAWPIGDHGWTVRKLVPVAILDETDLLDAD
jgi:hypothetical protein